MKESRSPLLTCSIGFAVLVLGSVILCGVIGNSTSANDLVAECILPENNAVVRLYEHSGSSATTSDSWSVTYQESESKEKAIFEAYSSPAVKAVKCEQNEVILIFYPGDDQESLSLDWIRSELVHIPLSFY